MPRNREENVTTIVSPPAQVKQLNNLLHLNVKLDNLHREITASIEDTVHWLAEHGLIANTQNA